MGGVFSRAAAEKVLAAGAPFVSLSRALICQPDFVERMEKGQTESPCLACNHCYNVYRQRPVRCVLHTEVIPSWRRCSAPTPPDFPRARSRIGERARSHFCPPVPALKKENRKNRKKDLTPAEKAGIIHFAVTVDRRQRHGEMAELDRRRTIGNRVTANTRSRVRIPPLRHAGAKSALLRRFFIFPGGRSAASPHPLL